MTSKLDSILVATDLSARCDRAFDRARLLARESGARLNILHVAEGDQFAASEEKEAAARKQVAEDLEGETAEIVISYGSVPKTIARTAEETGSDLLVSGVARWNGINDFILGTAVDHIVRHASRPVLVVKKKPHLPYRRLLVATDFSDCSRAALISASQMFPEASIHLIHALHVPFEGWLDSKQARDEWRDMAQEELDTFLAHAEISDDLRERIQPLLAYGDSQGEISKAIKGLEPDLLVLGTHGRGGVVRATIGSQASDLLSSMPVDTLMVRRT